MSYGYFGDATKSRAQHKAERGRGDRTRELIRNRLDRDLQKQRNNTYQVGPRIQFYHYIFDLNWDVDKAVDEILKTYTALNRDILLEWLKEKTSKREKGRMSSDEGR